MICPIDFAFPKMDEQILNKYTNTNNTSYSLVEPFTPKVFNNEDKVFNGVQANTAMLNNPSPSKPSKIYYNYLKDTIDENSDGDEDCKITYHQCPYCTKIIQITKPRIETNEMLFVAGLSLLIYTLL